ncbi:FKBP-type peptidyl-prolyl cis-trans isomerase [Arthrobacter sp.]|uniref:FKBP-type peptidyl-prolyl cis-trans isomerase n=1 Tax=Arthrobacter sp. TaxID=1667 RepID=UPI0026DF0AD0|nr:FKBP-type peptidyl-prolyl cis-trans isomerase [Arthrobacter sp.]MDO5753038.1 FKBP-type peptidyl-prolyl cis-trans isomerase [Arthrobacter sp.]
MRRLLALFVSLLFLVSACSQGSPEPPGDAGPTPLEPSSEAPPSASPTASPTTPQSALPVDLGVLASVQVVDQGDGNVPKIIFEKPLTVDKLTAGVLSDGDGAQIALGQKIFHRSIVIDGDTGEVVQENFTQPAGYESMLSPSYHVNSPTLVNAFISAKVGAYVAEAVPKPDVGENPPAWAQHATLMIYKVESAEDAPNMPLVLSAGEVASLAAEGKLPVATFDANGVPSITIPDTDAPTDLAVQVLTEGTGETIRPNDKFTALYTGWTWADSNKYDSAYDRGVADTFDFRTVIEGWLVGLTGQKVGSTIQLTVPANMLFDYQAGSLSRPAGPLVFVVKIVSKA